MDLKPLIRKFKITRNMMDKEDINETEKRIKELKDIMEKEKEILF